MKLVALFLLEIVLLISLSVACASVPASDIPPVYAGSSLMPPTKTMRAFRSDQELAAYLKKLAEEQTGKSRLYYNLKLHVVQVANLTLLPCDTLEQQEAKKKAKLQQFPALPAPTPALTDQEVKTQTTTKSDTMVAGNVIPFHQEEPCKWVGGIPVWRTWDNGRSYSNQHGGYIPLDMEEYKKNLH